MGKVIFFKRPEPADTAREADAWTARSIDELPSIAPWRRRQFDAQLRAIIGVESAPQTCVCPSAEVTDDDEPRAGAPLRLQFHGS
jgi:hypothetical protein